MVLVSIVIVMASFVFRECVYYCEAQDAVERGEEIPWCDYRDEDVLILARASFHESGDSIPDMAAIHLILRTLAEGRGHTFENMTRSYMPRLHARRSIRPWVMDLDMACREAPDGYPEHERTWTSTEREWARATLTAERVIAGKIAAECEGSIHDWGSPRIDRSRAKRLGLIPVACHVDGVMPVNDIYARPSWRRSGR